MALRQATLAALLALCGAQEIGAETDGSSTSATTTSSPGPTYGEQVPMTCTLKLNCTAPTIPRERGICVQQSGAGGTACRDVCDPNYAPQSYIESSNIAEQEAFAGIIEMVRAGKNPHVHCPGKLAQTDTCPLGDECDHDMHKKYDVPLGRGMCVLDDGEPNARGCWDVCDMNRLASDFSDGTSAGAEAKVMAMRSRCPGTAWWVWVLAVLGVLALGGCGVVLFIQLKNRKKRAGSSRSYDDRGSDMEYPQDFDGMREPMAEMPQRDVVPTQRSQRDEEDDMQAQQEYHMQMQYQQQLQQQQLQQQQQDTLPPEPPREPATSARQQASHRDDMSQSLLQDPLSGSRYGSGGVSPQGAHFTTMQPGSSMKIPGLDEPNLFNSIQPVVVPGAGQATSSSILMPSMSQPQVMPQFRTGSMGAVSYSTQVPPTFMPAGGAVQSPLTSPPASVQIQPGVLSSTQQGGAQFFTQIARR